MILLDTSGLFCYLHRDEPQHADAVSFFDTPETKLIHNYVIAEFIPLCQARGLNRISVLAFASNLLDSPLIETVWAGAELHRAALSLLEARLDKTYSLCDAVSFLLMRERSVSEALTTDHHFEQEGFVRLLTP